jgi:hypothetical protein
MKTVREIGAKIKVLYMKPLNKKPLISSAELFRPLDFAQTLLQDCSLMKMIKDNEFSQFVRDQNQSLQRTQPSQFYIRGKHVSFHINRPKG